MTFTSAMTPAEIDGVLDDHYPGDARWTRYEHLWVGLRVVSAAPPLRLHGPSLAIDELEVEGRITGPPFADVAGQELVRFRVLHVFELHEGAVVREHVWVDLGALTAQLAAPAAG